MTALNEVFLLDFPCYIPEIIKNHATHYLAGDDNDDEDWCGWIECLRQGKEKLSEIDEKIAELKTSINTGYAEDQGIELRLERLNIQTSHNKMEIDVDCIRRLISDDSMKEVYEILNSEFSGDEDRDSKILTFIHSAWGANINYSKPRESVNTAKQLSKEISIAAKKLADLLDKIDETGCNNLDEFFSIPYLLENTDNHGHDFNIWRSMRSVVVGKPPFRKQVQVDDMNSFDCDLYNESADQIDPIEGTINDLRYGWEKAPDLSELLRTVATAAEKAAGESEPNSGYFADAAISSRKRNPKTEYLRGYAELLRNSNIQSSPNILNAIVITATVILNSPDLIVIYDDVRKAVILAV